MAKRKPLPYALQTAVFYRDKWLCQACGRPVIFAPTLRLLALLTADRNADSKPAYYNRNYRRDLSPLLDELAVVVDHRVAHSRTQDDSFENLATLCNKCNLRKTNADYEHYLKTAKFKKTKGLHGEPEHWDGLVSVFITLAAMYPEDLTRIERAWLTAFKRHIAG